MAVIPAIGFSLTLFAITPSSDLHARGAVPQTSTASAPTAQAAELSPAERLRELQKRLLRGVIPADVLHVATELLDLPMDAEVTREVNGKSYLFRLEPHYHPAGFKGGPTGWHKGVTVYDGE
jgi:hypothetical protein